MPKTKRNLTTKESVRVLDLRLGGLSIRQIARQFNVNRPSIQKAIARLRK